MVILKDKKERITFADSPSFFSLSGNDVLLQKNKQEHCPVKEIIAEGYFR